MQQTEPLYASNLDFPLLEYYSFVEDQDFDYVYQPGDDSYLMLSILNQQAKSGRIGKHQVIAEVGSGTGILLSHVHNWMRQLKEEPIVAIATDINPQACRFSRKYYDYYHLPIQPICTSILDCIRLKPTLILCNPPYIPTEDEQTSKQTAKLKQVIKTIRETHKHKRTFDSNLIAWSWIGGKDGLHVIWKLLDAVNWHCVMYFVLIGDNPLHLFREKVQKKGYTVEILALKHKYNELLHIVRISSFK